MLLPHSVTPRVLGRDWCHTGGDPEQSSDCTCLAAEFEQSGSAAADSTGGSVRSSLTCLLRDTAIRYQHPGDSKPALPATLGWHRWCCGCSCRRNSVTCWCCRSLCCRDSHPAALGSPPTRDLDSSSFQSTLPNRNKKTHKSKEIQE